MKKPIICILSLVLLFLLYRIYKNKEKYLPTKLIIDKNINNDKTIIAFNPKNNYYITQNTNYDSKSKKTFLNHFIKDNKNNTIKKITVDNMKRSKNPSLTLYRDSKNNIIFNDSLSEIKNYFSSNDRDKINVNDTLVL